MNANDIIEKCAEVAVKRAENAHSGCERLSDTDPETGARECSLEVNGGDCLCIERQEEAETIGRAIRALKSSLPAETVSEAMVEEALTVLLNRISKNDFRIKTEDMRAALEAAALAHADDGWRSIDDNTPRDGTRLWLYWPSVEEDGRQTVGWWREGIHGGYWCDHADTERENPTHWRPLPAPPKDGRE